ncbi:MAG: aminotransferase class I/II-fold pyridoxal phosphate-dependent enzyme [Candidatus Lokiarchaeota archaeon]|nr:aminotransferase class I/II-fold pyridoxal phosphate-dependent enzyme [Candidatus Lokiarchaeota archaeon]
MEFKYLQKTPLYSALSDLGKRIFLPDGIFYWSGRAKKEAEIIGTIGSAFGFERDFVDGGGADWMPCYLNEISEYSNLGIKNIVPYASIGGLNETRELWKNWVLQKSQYNQTKEKDLIQKLEKLITTPIITAGVTNGIFQCSSLFLNPGEFIIAPNKRWGNYDNIIQKFIGAKIKSFTFFKDQNINLESLEHAINEVALVQEKVIIILNFPNNPTGYVPSKEEGKEIVSLLQKQQRNHKKPIVVIVDDAYEPYVYNSDSINRSIFYDLLQLEEDVIPIKLDGITKELLMYGGRIGFITLGLKSSWVENDQELELLKSEIDNKLEGFTRATISNCNHFYQALTQKLFKEKGIDKILTSRSKVKELLKKRYEKINSELAKINDPNISIDPNSGGFFLFLNLNPDKIKANEFGDHLLKKYKVGIIPIEKLDEQINGIRIAYCSVDLPKIPELIKRIKLALNDF